MIKKLGSFIASFFLFTNLSLGELYTVGLDKEDFTSDFMMGEVVVSIIFPESDGSFDANTETWSTERQTQVISKIVSGLEWWTKQNTRIPLSFTFLSQTVSTRYEPITRPYYDEALWIPDIMDKLGYSTGSRFQTTKDYANALRDQYNSDWAFTIFVVDSEVDTNGKFADGYFAYAYLGGPFVVMTYDNNGYGITNMDVVAAHETGHIFHALDEYAGGGSPSDYSFGYFPTINGNHAYSQLADEPNSIMRGGIRWGLSSYTRRMVGWVDSDNNGMDDILDAKPSSALVLDDANSTPGSTGMLGQASVNVVPRQGNSEGHGMTVDSISTVEYSVSANEWAKASPVDGKFDSAQESFNIVVPASQVSGAFNLTVEDVDVQILTTYAVYANASSGGGGGSTPTSLDNAHAFPNPFKPNSSLGHSQVTFTNLTAGSKVVIFTLNGDRVVEKAATGSPPQFNWDAKDDSGSKVASGVYYYLITDPNGGKQKGKLAIIR